MAECASTSNLMESFSLPSNIDSLSGPEKLVIFVDSTCFSSEFKRILKNFLEVKCLVNRHEVAVAVMSGTDVNTVGEFQTDVKSIFSPLWSSGSRWHAEQNHFYNQKETFDLSKVFRSVLQLTKSFEDQNVSLRVIILYGRVDCIPVLENDDAFKTLQALLPLFTLDVLYMPQYSMKCARSVMVKERQTALSIFQVFVDISNEKSYVFAVSETANVSACVLKLLAHPALRQAQKKDWFE